MKDLSEKQHTLHASCANMLVTSTMAHWGRLNQQRTRMIQSVLQPLEKWQQHANRELRQVSTSSSWLLGQLDGSGLYMVVDTASLLQDRQTLRHIGFTGPNWFAECGGLNDYRIAHDDELADHMGRLALGGRSRVFAQGGLAIARLAIGLVADSQGRPSCSRCSELLSVGVREVLALASSG